MAEMRPNFGNPKILFALEQMKKKKKRILGVPLLKHIMVSSHFCIKTIEGAPKAEWVKYWPTQLVVLVQIPLSSSSESLLIFLRFLFETQGNLPNSK